MFCKQSNAQIGFLPGFGSVTELVVETVTLCRTGNTQNRKPGKNGQSGQTQTQEVQHFGTAQTSIQKKKERDLSV